MELPHTHEKNRWILHLTMRCNYYCAYCIQKETIARENMRVVRGYNELDADKWLSALARLDYRPPMAIVMGGEPSLHRGFTDIVIGLHMAEYNLDITTNLSFDVQKFIDELRRRNVALPRMWTTYHPEQADAREFLLKASQLKHSGLVGLTVSYMSPDEMPHLLSDKHKHDLDEFHKYCGHFGISALKAHIRDQREGEAYARRAYPDGKKIRRPIKCTSSWVNIAPDGEIYNCAYHMSLGKNSFGNITRPDSIKRIPEMGEWFDCEDYGWCEACHEQSGHGGFREP